MRRHNTIIHLAKGMVPKQQTGRDMATTIPLVAALLAPLSTLMDIPALTQHWYTYQGVPLSDPPACLILSAIGLALNLAANLLLVVRFSASQRRWWATATRLSTINWIAKTIVAIVNLIIFGATTRNGDGYSYGEAFWCAIVSVILAGAISVMLTCHYFFAFDRDDGEGDAHHIRMQGRHFMLSISFLLIVVAVQALIYSKIEGWSYFDGIYFSIVTMMTIGFGDFHPTYVSTKILLLPFAIVTISQLANEVSIIVDYFSERAKNRREVWRGRYERAIKQQARKRNPQASLKEEIALIDEIASQEEFISQMYDLFWSLSSLITFWLVGAAVFQAIQPDFTFWTAWYFEIEFSLTIGYGDYALTTPGAKVFFVVYSLAAVPLIASFAVQTVTGLLSTFASQGQKMQREKRAELQQSEAFYAHKDFVLQHYDTLEKWRTQGKIDASRKNSVNEDDAGSTDESQEKKRTISFGFGDTNATQEEKEGRGNGESRGGAGEQESEAKGLREDGGKALNDMQSERGIGKQGDQVEDPREEGQEALKDMESQGDGEEQGSRPPDATDDDEEALDDMEENTVVASPSKESDPEKQEDLGRTDTPEPDDAHASTRSVKNYEITKDEEKKLVEDLINSAIVMEAIARRLLIDSLPKSSLGRTILKADFELQYRDVKQMGGDADGLANLWKHESERAEHEKHPTDVHPEAGSSLDQIRRYRETFARLLVVGSELQRLEGKDRYRFERRKDEETVEEIEEEADREENESITKTGHIKKMSPWQRASERRRLMKVMVNAPVSDPTEADNPV